MIDVIRYTSQISVPASQSSSGAVINAASSFYGAGARTYGFHAYDSALTSGIHFDSKLAVWFVSYDSVITKRHIGLEFVHTSRRSGERIDLLLIDPAGVLSWATPVYTSITNSYNFSAWVSNVSGSDSNNGSSVSTPKATLGAAHELIRNNWTPSGEHVLFIEGNFSVSTAGGSILWNGNSVSSGGSELPGRLSHISYGSGGYIGLGKDDSYYYNTLGKDRGFLVSGLYVSSQYTISGSVTTTNLALSPYISSGGLGYNLTVLDSVFSGFQWHLTLGASLDVSYLSGTALNWISVENSTLGDAYAYQGYASKFGNLGYYNVKLLGSGGNQTGSAFRFVQARNISHTKVLWDRSSSPSYQGNTWRCNGGDNTSEYDNCSRYSMYDCSFVNCIEPMEFDMFTGMTSDKHMQNMWITSNQFIMPSSQEYRHPIYFAFGDTFGIAASGIKFQNNIARMGVGGSFVNITHCPTPTTGKYNKIVIDSNTIYSPSSIGSFTRTDLVLNVGGDQSNFANSSLTITNNYLFTSETRSGSHPTCFMSEVQSSKILRSDYNVSRRAGAGSHTFYAGSSLATWQSATGKDANSSEGTSASHNMVNVDWTGFNSAPNSGTGPQIDVGEPNGAYIYANGKVRSATPEAGALGWSETSDYPTPTF